MRFSLPSRWSQQLFIALARRYGLKPFRYRREHATQLMLRVKQRFLEEIFSASSSARCEDRARRYSRVRQ